MSINGEFIVKELGSGDLDKITASYLASFENNQFYKHTIGFDNRDLTVFFKSLHKLIFDDAGNSVKCLVDGQENIVSIGTVTHPEWYPKMSKMLGTFWEFSTGLGFSRANKIIKFVKEQDQYSSELKQGWHIVLFGTHPDFQRQGHGSTLINDFLYEQDGETTKQAFLDAVAGSEAEKFYLKAGFKEAQRSKISGVEFCRLVI